MRQATARSSQAKTRPIGGALGSRQAPAPAPAAALRVQVGCRRRGRPPPIRVQPGSNAKQGMSNGLGTDDVSYNFSFLVWGLDDVQRHTSN